MLLKRAGGGLEEVQAAVCYDCHGVHEIRSVTDPEATAMRENLVSTCQRCHPGITASFPAAWLSHRQPSLSQASAVFYTEIFFTALTVAVIVGLIAHIALELLRAARSSLRTNAGVSQGERREEE